jgi:hypothetical protein
MQGRAACHPVADLIAEDAGAAFPHAPRAPVTAMPDWSRLIWDLLAVTARQTAPLVQVGAAPGTTRGNPILFSTGAAEPPSSPRPDLPAEEAPPEGLGIIELSVGPAGAPVEPPDVDGDWDAA